jgi:hypothetical protein
MLEQQQAANANLRRSILAHVQASHRPLEGIVE